MHTPQEDKIMKKTHRFMTAAVKALEGTKDNRAKFECTECHETAITIKTKNGIMASCNHCEIRVMN